jgi:hypothetical protein
MLDSIDIKKGFEKSKEGWKEEFLKGISKKYGGNELLKFENQDYKLIGLPLFNHQDKLEFENAFNNQLLNKNN